VPSRDAYLRRWLLAVYAAKLPTACRDTLTAYGLHMDRDGLIRIPRSEIEEWTHRPRRAIDRHIAAAISDGLLEVADRHSPGRPASYRATIPTVR
jgi:hypothetical protein